jgi:hypothetical protein
MLENMNKNMKNKNVQTVLKISEYKKFREALKLEKLSLKEGAREAILSWTRQRIGFNEKDPFFATKNLFSGRKDLAEKHDKIYEGKE